MNFIINVKHVEHGVSRHRSLGHLSEGVGDVGAGVWVGGSGTEI